MKVIFFNVDGVLNFPGSEAKAPSGKIGVADARVGQFKHLINQHAARVMLIGPWTKDWDFDADKRTEDGVYLNKKLERRGIHILDKTENIETWLRYHSNVTEYCVLENLLDVNWEAHAE